MRNKKTQFKVEDFKALANELLKQQDAAATDAYKKGVCELLERVLRKCNREIEYDYTYWKESGYMQWMQDGEPEVADKKQKYILGPSGQEYNRTYR